MVDQTLYTDTNGDFNIIHETRPGMVLETRFVQREPDTGIIYVSSQDGCEKACRMCWLTQQGNTSEKKASVQDFVAQVERAMLNICERPEFDQIKTIHVNFMARGDILSNDHFTGNPKSVLDRIHKKIWSFNKRLQVVFKLSTIFPNDIDLEDVAQDGPLSQLWLFVNSLLSINELAPYTVELFYSLYSLKPEFRKKWLPKALDPELVGNALFGRDQHVVLHHALIDGENDTEEDVALIHDWLERHDLDVRFNHVAYNPFKGRVDVGDESDPITTQTYLSQLDLSHRISHIRRVPRVSPEIYASCGMFVET